MEQPQYILFTAGKDIRKLYDSLKYENEDEGFDPIVKKVATHFNPTSNITFNIFTLKAINQAEFKSFSEFYT